jgi:uncharacterized cupin superfamily protein
MQELHNIDHVPREFMDDPDREASLSTKYLGVLAGSVNIYVNVDYVKPGAMSVKYHSHSLQEEFFLVLEGTGILRIEDRKLRVGKGDFISKPPGRGIAHQFINDGDGTLVLLDCGIRDPDDIIEYPDEGVMVLRNRNLAFRRDEFLGNWSSDPNL